MHPLMYCGTTVSVGTASVLNRSFGDIVDNSTQIDLALELGAAQRSGFADLPLTALLSNAASGILLIPRRFLAGRRTTTTTSNDDSADQPNTMAAGDDGDATTLVPPPTEAAANLAWSSEDETVEIHRQSWGLTWGRVGVLLACTSVVALAVGFGGWALMRTHDKAAAPYPVTSTPASWATPPPPDRESTTTATPAPESPAAATAQPSIESLPGTDRLGWIAYPGARCDPGTQPAVMARTTQSLLVICEIQPGDFYYRGVRLSDGASIELPNAVHSSEGFDVTNPADGTRYRIRPTSLTIAPPDAPASSEAMLQYASTAAP